MKESEFVKVDPTTCFNTGRGTKRQHDSSSGFESNISTDSSTNINTWSPPTKKLKTETTSSTPSTSYLSYVKMLEKEKGIVITKEMVKERVEELRHTDIFEAWKYYLEMYDLFRGDDAEGREYYNTLLNEVRQARKKQMEEERSSSTDLSLLNTTNEQDQQQTTPTDQQQQTTPSTTPDNTISLHVDPTTTTTETHTINEVNEEVTSLGETVGSSYDLSQNSEPLSGGVDFSHSQSQSQSHSAITDSYHYPHQSSQHLTSNVLLSESENVSSHPSFTISESPTQQQLQETQNQSQQQEQNHPVITPLNGTEFPNLEHS